MNWVLRFEKPVAVIRLCVEGRVKFCAIFVQYADLVITPNAPLGEGNLQLWVLGDVCEPVKKHSVCSYIVL